MLGLGLGLGLHLILDEAAFYVFYLRFSVPLTKYDLCCTIF